MNYLIKTNSSLEYTFEANHFQISEGIIHFFDDEGDVVWVIKDWISCMAMKDKKEKTPDEFYESLNEEES